MAWLNEYPRPIRRLESRRRFQRTQIFLSKLIVIGFGKNVAQNFFGSCRKRDGENWYEEKLNNFVAQFPPLISLVAPYKPSLNVVVKTVYQSKTINHG
jgi:hypothetical protein